MSEEYDDFIAHFGVLGMRWGKTKASNPYTSKSNYRLNLESKYISKGISAKDAEVKAAKRIKVQKVLAITAGVAVAATAAYVAKVEIGKRFTEINLPAGAELRNINVFGKAADFNRRTFVTIDANDAKKYRGMYARTLRMTHPDKKVFETVLKAKEGIKAPSHVQAKKLYKEYLFKEGKTGVMKYKQFNQGLVQLDMDHNPFAAIFAPDDGPGFIKFIQSKGYNALLDANDQFLSGYNTKKPLILFNAASSTVKAGQQVVDATLSNKLFAKQAAASWSRFLAPKIGLGVGYVYGKKAIESNSLTARKAGIVNEYIAKHPNTKLTYSELISKVDEVGNGELFLNINP